MTLAPLTRRLCMALGLAIGAALLGAATAGTITAQAENQPKPSTAPVSLDRLVSGDVLAYVTAPDARKLVDSLASESPFAKLLAHPEVVTFLSPLTDALSALEDDVGGFLGGGWTLFARSLTGPLSLAVTAPDGEGPRAVPNAIASIGLRDTAVFRRVVDRLANVLPLRYDVEIAREPVAGHTVVVFEWGERFSLYVCFVGNVLYVSNAASAMEGVLLARARGAHPAALAESPAFQRARLRVAGKTAHHWVYVNIPLLWRETDRLFGRGFPEYDFLMKALDARRVHTVAASVVVDAGGFRERAYVGGKEAAIRHLLVPGLTGSDWAKPGSVMFAGFRMNWTTLYDWFKATVDDGAKRFQSRSLRSLHRTLRRAEEGAIGIDFGQDVIAALGDEVIVRADLPVGGMVPQFLAIANVEDEKRLQGAFDKIRESLPPEGDVTLGQSRYRSKTIYRLRTGGPIEPAFAVVDGKFVAAVNINILKRWIRRPEGGLGRSPAFTEALGRIDRTSLDDALGAFYLDTPRALAFAYDNLGPLLAGFAPRRINLGMRSATLSFDRLPSTNAIASHFSSMIVVSRLVDDGVAIDAHTPAPYLGTVLAICEGSLFTGMSGVSSGTAIGAGTPRETGATGAPGATGAMETTHPPVSQAIPGELGVLVDDDYAADGCRVARVLPDTAAAAAGLRDGDVISRIDGAGLKDADAAFAVLAKKRAGDTVKLQVVRGGKTVTIAVRLRPKP